MTNATYETTTLDNASVHAKQQHGLSFYREVAETMAAKAGVTVKYHDDGVEGIAWPHASKVEGPRPTSRRRLAFLGYLIGYVLEAANAPSEASLQFTAWQYSITQLEEQGISIPRRTLKRAKRDIAYLLHGQFVGDADIDLDAAKWCEPYLSQRVKMLLSKQVGCYT